MIELSEQLLDYIKQITKETQKPVLIQVVDDLGFRGMKAKFIDHPENIIIQIEPGMHGKELEQSIAHEVTHGLLSYGRRYCRISPKEHLGETDKKSIEILATMIEDIVVNRIIHDEGFEPFSSIYLDEVRKETASAQGGRNHYTEFSDPVFRERFMIFRYIMAWGFLHYFHLSNTDRLPLIRFEKAFRNRYIKQYKIAKQIKEILLSNNISAPEGYCAALKETLTHFHLDHLVDLRPTTS